VVELKEIVAFGNCQARAFTDLLPMAVPDGDYKVSYYSNNQRTGGMVESEEILSAVGHADVLVFQPLRKEWGALSEDNIKEAAGRAEVALRFPYIFNSGISGVCCAPQAKVRAKAYGVIFGEKQVVDVLRAGATADDAVDAYVSGEIDFELRQRFDRCMTEMRRRESTTELKLADYVEQNYQKKKQYLSHNHPTTDLVVEMCDQVRRLAGLPVDMDKLRAIDDPNVVGLHPGRAPVSPYDAEVLGYEFGPDDDWEPRGTELVRRIAEEFEANPDSFDTDGQAPGEPQKVPASSGN
jgi:hypothetical protein